MYHLLSYNEVLSIIADTVGVKRDVVNHNSKAYELAYDIFLNRHSIFNKTMPSGSMHIIDFDSMNLFSSSYSEKMKGFYDVNSSLLQKRIKNDFFLDALHKLKKQNVEIYSLCKLTAKVILLNQLKKYTNGTTQDTIGMASMDFKDHFLQNDFLELLVHQLTHILLFIDDISNQHMEDEDKDIPIPSKLVYVHGGNNFPAYFAFHSYIVGVEVSCYRLQNLPRNYCGKYHGSWKRVIKVTNRFEEALFNNIKLFSIRGKELLAIAREKNHKIQATVGKYNDIEVL